MELEMDLWQPVRENLVAVGTSRLVALGPVIDDVSPSVGPGKRAYSFWAECECPGDCLRDHENE